MGPRRRRSLHCQPLHHLQRIPLLYLQDTLPISGLSMELPLLLWMFLRGSGPWSRRMVGLLVASDFPATILGALDISPREGLPEEGLRGG